MNDLNSVFLVGRLVADATSKGGVVNFSLVNNHYTYDEERKDYLADHGKYRVVLQGKVEKFLPLLKKGVRIGVNGRLSTDGVKVTVQAYTIQALDSAERKTA